MAIQHHNLWEPDARIEERISQQTVRDITLTQEAACLRLEFPDNRVLSMAALHDIAVHLMREGVPVTDISDQPPYLRVSEGEVMFDRDLRRRVVVIEWYRPENRRQMAALNVPRSFYQDPPPEAPPVEAEPKSRKVRLRRET